MKKSYFRGSLKTLCITTLVFMVFSCAEIKQVPYFQDVQDGAKYRPEKVAQIRMKPQDKISIVVNTKDNQLNQWYNLAVPQQYVGSGNLTSGVGRVSYYTIDENGEIDFPVLGKLKVEGMTRSMIAEYIKQRLIEDGLVKNPVVIVEYADLTVSVMGEVARPGCYAITKDYFTLLDALSAAGDITIHGKRQNVLVFRQEGNESVPYRVDLCSASDVYHSPVFYLQQNDVIYVEPTKTRARQSTTSGNSFASTSFWISLGTLAVTIVSLLIRIK